MRKNKKNNYQGERMEIKSIPETIREIDEFLKENDYEKAYETAKESIDLNKEYIEGEYVFKNLLEELLFQITIKKEIKRKYPIALDYSSLYANYGKILIHFDKIIEAEKSFRLSNNFNPVNVESIFGLIEIAEIKENWEDYHNLTIQTFKYSYSRENLSKSFKYLSKYYLNNYFDENNEDDLKIAVYLKRLSEEYSNKEESENNFSANTNEENFFSKITNENDLELIKDYENEDLSSIKDYLKSIGLPYSAGIEIITICKNLGFQLDEGKKVVPALFYFNIAYELTGDPNIKISIDELNEKIERRKNE